jgi:RNA polymerase sigma-70 factor, ECF subfamily
MDVEDRFESLFRANYDDLLRFAVRRVGSDAAADVVAEVFAVAWRRRDAVPDGAERLWLFGVAANVVANERRSRQPRNRLARRVADGTAISSTGPPSGRRPDRSPPQFYTSRPTRRPVPN